MKDRRPRKLKKKLKKQYASACAVRVAQCAITTAMSAIHTVIVASKPVSKHDQAGLANKVIGTVKIAMDCANTVAGTLKSGPKNWREAV